MFRFLEKFKKNLQVNFVVFVSFVFFPVVCWGADDQMTLITKEWITHHPHNAVLKIQSHFGERQMAGTGFLIDKNFALTAAHVVYNKECFADQVDCWISSHGLPSEKPVTVIKYIVPLQYEDHPQQMKLHREKINQKISEKVDGLQQCHQSYLQKIRELKDYLTEIEDAYLMVSAEVWGYDYALLYFDFDLPEESFSIVEPTVCEKSQEEALFFCGYPLGVYEDVKNPESLKSFSPTEKEKENQTLLSSYYPYKVKATKGNSANPNYWIFSTLCYGGMSGGPIMYEDKESNIWKAIAILCGNSAEHSLGCHFTQPKLTTLNKWKILMQQGENHEQIRLAGGILMPPPPSVFDSLFGT